MKRTRNTLDLQTLRTFLTVVRVGNLTRAAQELYLTQPAVSFQLKNLERYYGVPLLERQGKRMVPTGAGEGLTELALDLLRLEEETLQAVRAKGVGTGTVRLGASSIPGEFILPSILGANPGAIILEVGDSLLILEKLRRGELDLAVVGASPEFSGHRVGLLTEDELVLAVSPSSPLASRTDLELRELADVTIIMREEGSGTRDTFEKFLKAAEVGSGALRVAAHISSNAGVLAAVASGIGVAIISRLATVEGVRAGNFKVLSFRPLLRRQFYWVLGQPPTAAAEEFLAILRTSI